LFEKPENTGHEAWKMLISFFTPSGAGCKLKMPEGYLLIKELYCPAKSPTVRVRRFMLNIELKIGTMDYH